MRDARNYRDDCTESPGTLCSTLATHTRSMYITLPLNVAYCSAHHILRLAQYDGSIGSLAHASATNKMQVEGWACSIHPALSRPSRTLCPPSSPPTIIHLERTLTTPAVKQSNFLVERHFGNESGCCSLWVGRDCSRDRPKQSAKKHDIRYLGDEHSKMIC